MSSVPSSTLSSSSSSSASSAVLHWADIVDDDDEQEDGKAVEDVQTLFTAQHNLSNRPSTDGSGTHSSSSASVAFSSSSSASVDIVEEVAMDALELDEELDAECEGKIVAQANREPSAAELELNEDLNATDADSYDDYSSETAPSSSSSNPSSFLPARIPLPIDEHVEEICSEVFHNPISVIQGDTGCGKSSRVPQMVLDYYRDFYRSFMKTVQGSQRSSIPLPHPQPFIVCTQPRRIAAIALAKRVAEERGEPIGQTVGYKVGLEASVSKSSQLIFVTTGWLLQKLVFNPHFLHRCTHIILDEIHERSIDADLLYVVLKRILATQHRLPKGGWKGATPPPIPPRLVLMSATFNTNMFGEYFHTPLKSNPTLIPFEGQHLKPNTIFVGMQRFKVDLFYMETMLNAPILRRFYPLIERRLGPPPIAARSLLRYQNLMDERPPSVSSLVMDQMVWLLGALALCHMKPEDRAEDHLQDHNVPTDDNSNITQGNCILVFFPGLREIEDVATALDDAVYSYDSGSLPSPYKFMDVFILHSLVDDQMKVFEPIEVGRTRVVLATNIAESSVTLPHVRFVIDTGTHKETEYNPRYQTDQLSVRWISQASAKQRAGRSGRLCPGTVFRFYSKKMYEEGLNSYDTPEILRVSLAATILRLKMSGVDHSHQASVPTNSKRNDEEQDKNGQGSAFGDPQSVLEDTLEPPSLTSMHEAFDELIQCRALLLPTAAQAKFGPRDYHFDDQPSTLLADEKGDDDDADEDDGDEGDVSLSSSEDVSDWEHYSERPHKKKHKEDHDHQQEGEDITRKLNKALEKIKNEGKKKDEKRLAYGASIITPLGRFFAALPFSFHYGKLLAYSVILGGRSIVHSVIIASYLSLQDPFILPHPRVITDTRQYCDLVFKTTCGRIWADAGYLSDAIASIVIFREFCIFRRRLKSYENNHHYQLQRWCDQKGLHLKRLKTFVNTVGEIALRVYGLTANEFQRKALLRLAALASKKHREARMHQNQNQNAFFSKRFQRPSSSSSSADGFRSSSDHLLGSVEDDARFLQLDECSVMIIRFLLTHTFLKNLMIGQIACGSLSELNSTAKKGDKDKMRGDLCLSIKSVPQQFCSLESFTNLPELRCVSDEIQGTYFTEIVMKKMKAGGKGRKTESMTAAAKATIEFYERPKNSKEELFRVAACDLLDEVSPYNFGDSGYGGKKGRNNEALAKQPDEIPVITMAPTAMVAIYRMQHNSKLPLSNPEMRSSQDRDRGNRRGDSRRNQGEVDDDRGGKDEKDGVSGLCLDTIKLPGKSIKWKFHNLDSFASSKRLGGSAGKAQKYRHRNPASQMVMGDPVSLISHAVRGLTVKRTADLQLTDLNRLDRIAEYRYVLRKMKGSGQFSAGNSRQQDNENEKAKRVKKKSKKDKDKSGNAFTVYGLACTTAMTNRTVRAERLSMLPFGVNKHCASIILALCFPGAFEFEDSAIIGVHEDQLFTFPLWPALPRAIANDLLAMKRLLRRAINEDFAARVDSLTLEQILREAAPMSPRGVTHQSPPAPLTYHSVKPEMTLEDGMRAIFKTFIFSNNHPLDLVQPATPTHTPNLTPALSQPQQPYHQHQQVRLLPPASQSSSSSYSASSASSSASFAPKQGGPSYGPNVAAAHTPPPSRPSSSTIRMIPSSVAMSAQTKHQVRDVRSLQPQAKEETNWRSNSAAARTPTPSSNAALVQASSVAHDSIPFFFASSAVSSSVQATATPNGRPVAYGSVTDISGGSSAAGQVWSEVSREVLTSRNTAASHTNTPVQTAAAPPVKPVSSSAASLPTSLVSLHSSAGSPSPESAFGEYEEEDYDEKYEMHEASVDPEEVKYSSGAQAMSNRRPNRKPKKQMPQQQPVPSPAAPLSASNAIIGQQSQTNERSKWRAVDRKFEPQSARSAASSAPSPAPHLPSPVPSPSPSQSPGPSQNTEIRGGRGRGRGGTRGPPRRGGGNGNGQGGPRWAVKQSATADQ